MAVIGWMTVFYYFWAGAGPEGAYNILVCLRRLAAALAAFGLADMGTQLLWFVAVSFLSLAIVRPAAFLARRCRG